MHKARIAAAVLATVSLVTTLGACSSETPDSPSDSPCSAAQVLHQANQPGVIQAAYTPRPRTPAHAPTTRPRTQKPVVPTVPRTPTKTPATPTKTSTPTARPTTATPRPSQGAGKLQLSPKRVRPSGEAAYYPPLLIQQSDDNIYLVLDTYRTLKRSSKYRSPVTKHVYVYHTDDYFYGLPWQDLYNPFDPRNWINSLSPFYGLAWEQDGELEFPDTDEGQGYQDDIPADEPSC